MQNSRCSTFHRPDRRAFTFSHIPFSPHSLHRHRSLPDSLCLLYTPLLAHLIYTTQSSYTPPWTTSVSTDRSCTTNPLLGLSTAIYASTCHRILTDFGGKALLLTMTSSEKRASLSTQVMSNARRRLAGKSSKATLLSRQRSSGTPTPMNASSRLWTRAAQAARSNDPMRLWGFRPAPTRICC